jgi:hypothetical protein
VSSANRSGLPSATTAAAAEEQLGNSVSVYLDGGVCASALASTIIDLTGDVPRLLRAGAISLDKIREVAAVAGLEERDPAPDEPDEPAEPDPDQATADSSPPE